MNKYKKEKIVCKIFDFLSNLFPDTIDTKNIEDFHNPNFYSGTDLLNRSDSNSNHWNLGYSQSSLLPENCDYDKQKFYTGGCTDGDIFENPINFFKEKGSFKNYCKSVRRSFSNGFLCRIRKVHDDMRVRAVAVNDDSERGITVFAVADCIGLSNKIICDIRSRVVEKSNYRFNFSSITIASTHCHSCIDTQGLWTNPVSKCFGNAFKIWFHKGKLKTGTDPEYIDYISEKIANTIIDACSKMEPGMLTYAVKDISTTKEKHDNFYNERSNYFYHKRKPQSTALITDLNRFIFTPDNKVSRPVMMINVSAHPYFTAIAVKDGRNNGDGISGDFVYYMEELINKAGYDFLFFNGAVASVYPSTNFTKYASKTYDYRVDAAAEYGRALAKIALSLTLTEEQIKRNPLLVDPEIENAENKIYNEHGIQYHPWFETWEPVQEINLNPVLNTSFRQINIKVTNPVIKLMGKLNLASYNTLIDGDDYYIATETGIVDFGNGIVKFAMIPGELLPDLAIGGGALTAKMSCSGTDFMYPTVSEALGKNTIIFGLANDAIGYILPDNDFCLCLDFGAHYHELLSIGSETASTIIKELINNI